MMNFLARVKNAMAAGRVAFKEASPLSAGQSWFNNFSPLSAEFALPERALKISTVYACISCLTGAIKSMPIRIFSRDEKGSVATGHKYLFILNERAADDWSAADAWSFLLTSKFLYGDGYARLIRKDYRSSEVVGWQPLDPRLVDPFRGKDGIKRYKVASAAGGANYEVVNAADIVQITSPGYDGLRSPSVISAAAEVLITAFAGQEWQSKFFSSGANFDYVLSSDSTLTPTQVAQLRDSLMKSYSKDGGPLILSAGIKPMSLSINPRDAELLNSRIFTREEICQFFGVPPFMVGLTDKSSSWGTGVGEMGQQFVKYTLLPHLAQIAEEFNYKLWPIRDKFYLKHDTTEMERGDLKSRSEGYRVAVGRAGEPGWMTINEVRAAEDMYPVEWGDGPGFEKEKNIE